LCKLVCTCDVMICGKCYWYFWHILLSDIPWKSSMLDKTL